MPVQVFDTLSRQFKPIAPKEGTSSVGFYCCGPTVYGPAHIGNFRTFLVQDVLRRVLEVDGVPVVHVRNITDVDDKTIARSLQEGKSLQEFTEAWTARFHTDAESLNCLKPHVEPRAAAHIPQQVAMIARLVARGNAYASADGSVYFRVASFPRYGELARLDMLQLQTQETNSAGDSNDADEYERDSIRDFALWKARKPEDGPNFWPSPWGEGRPGWHIECSAMSVEYLGHSFALHGGGIDLCFPHHTNEIAQSECATGCCPFVAHWFHSAHLLVEGNKMSKSLGNVWRLDDCTAKGFSPMEVRWALLSGHYRQPLNFTHNGLTSASGALNRIAKSVRALLVQTGLTEADFRGFIEASDRLHTGVFQPAWEALCNDLNVPEAQGLLFTALKDLERDPDFDRSALRGQLRALGSLLYCLGIRLFDEPQSQKVSAPEAVERLARERWEAKQSRQWAKADSLRQEIAAQGWKVLDRKDGYSLEPL